MIKKISDEKIIKIVIGGAVIAVFCMKNPGAGGFFMLTVVCTLGVGLVGWGFLAYLIGTVIYAIAAMILEKFGVFTSKDKEKLASMSKEVRAIVDYIRVEKAGGISEQDIAAALKEKGWSDNEIAAAMDISQIALG